MDRTWNHRNDTDMTTVYLISAIATIIPAVGVWILHQYLRDLE